MVGLLWGFLFGDYQTSLGVGIFFELFWLDQIPAGTYIPPNTVLSTFLTLSLVQYFSLISPSAIMLPLALSVPLALMGAKIEYYQRRWQDSGYNTLLQWARIPVPRRNPHQPERLVMLSLLQQLCLNFALFTVGLLVLIGLLTIFPLHSLLYIGGLKLTWPHLWLMAALGGLLALRVKRSYAILSYCVVLLVLLGFARS